MATPQIKAFYNEINPHCCAMLQQLMDDGIITAGKIDDRPIQDIRPEDVTGYDRVHFFAGIGGWDVALNLANWAGGFVWTGSCPCQPFSSAGKGGKQSDERHLWPHWYRLIRESRPSIIFGEQVASAIAAGWWDDVATDLEAEGYSCAAAVLPACSVGRPHRRDRLWFVGYSQSERCREAGEISTRYTQRPPNARPASGTMADSHDLGRQYVEAVAGSDAEGMGAGGEGEQSGTVCSSSDVAESFEQGLEGYAKHEQGRHESRWKQAEEDGSITESDTLEWLECPDGKWRPTLSGLRLLANGVQHRTPILHGFGNAIVPSLAAAFIESTKGVIQWK